MKILVTGATGSIGGAVARYLRQEGRDVRCLVRQTGTIEGFDEAVGDLLAPETLIRACAGTDVVLNFAALLGRWSIPNRMLESVNIDGPGHLVTAAKKAGVRYVLHVSAAGVAGPLGHTLGDESTPCHPATPYEITKCRGEINALALAGKIGMPLGVIRPTFTYGPGDRHKLGLFKAIKQRRFFYIGNGKSTIHPVFIDDVIYGVQLMMKHRPDQEVYIIGGPRPATVTELAETIAKALGVKAPGWGVPSRAAMSLAILLEGMGKVVNREPPLTRSKVLTLSTHRRYCIDKARRDLGFSPRVDIAEGIAQTANWYRDHGLL